MKKVLGILAILSLLMVPCVSMAATMSDADLAAVTGQAGVTIELSSLNMMLSVNTLTYGDLDGFAAATDAGFVNIAFYPAPMYIGVGAVVLTIDVGTDTTGVNGPAGKTYVNIATTVAQINVLALIVDVYLNSYDGVHDDFTAGIATPYVHHGYGTGFSVEGGITNSIGRIGISGVSVTLQGALNIKISAH